MNVAYLARALAPYFIKRGAAASIRGLGPAIRGARALYSNRVRLAAGAAGAVKAAGELKKIVSSKSSDGPSSRTRSSSIMGRVNQGTQTGSSNMTYKSRGPKGATFVGKRKRSYRKKKVVKQKDKFSGRAGRTAHTASKKTISFKGYNPGVQLRLEQRTETTAQQCAYLLHGSPMAQIWKLLWQTIVKDLFTQKGGEILNMNLNIPGTNQYFITVAYFANSQSTAISSFSYVVASTDTYIQAAVGLELAYRTAFSNNPRTPLLDRISLDQYTEVTPGGSSVNHAQINCESYMFGFSCQSVLKFRNTTLAKATGVADVTNDDAGDVLAQPLVGYKYVNTKDTAFIPKVREDSYASFVPLHLPYANGLLFQTAAQLGQETGTGNDSTTNNYFKKPPPAKFFVGIGKRLRVTMQPGEILTDVCKWQRKMNLRKFIMLYHDQAVITNTANYVQVPMGCATLIALEHKLFFTGDPNISIQGQQDLSISVCSKQKSAKKRVITYTQVS